jgi:hypothetical protein
MSAGRMHMEEKLKSSEQQTSRMGYRFQNFEQNRAEWDIIFESKTGLTQDNKKTSAVCH